MNSNVVIHIVDDEETVRSSLAFLLSTSGYNARTYGDAASFLAHAPAIANGCLITDLRMPEVDGIELLRRLDSLDAMLPAIVMTGHGDIQSAIEALAAGALDFIEKPFSQEVLFASIARVLEAASNPIPADEITRRLSVLDESEERVLRALVLGLNNKAIAAELGVSSDLVSRSSERVLRKMKASGLPELIRMWNRFERGIARD